MSRVVRIHETGGPEVLRIDDLEVGPAGPGELRVRIEAIGLNRSEAIFRAGSYLAQPQLPALVGYEACGTVESLGPQVSGFTVGQRVCILPTFRMGDYGVYAELARVPARSVIPAPEGLTSVEAAAVWMAFLTAWGIVEAGRATVGDFVLVPAAASSVGLAAIQIANWIGAEPIALTRKAGKVDALHAQGARHVVDLSSQDLAAEVERITGGRGVQVVFDPVGGPFVETLAQTMAPEGRLIIYGSLSGQPTPFPHWPACLKSLSLRGWVFSFLAQDPAKFARVRELILRGLEGGQLRPVVARSFALSQIVEAHHYLEGNQQVGKIVVTV